jgi:hypothetical protein
MPGLKALDPEPPNREERHKERVMLALGIVIAIVLLERFPIRWNHLIKKQSLRFKELEHILMKKVAQLIRGVLWD